MISRSYRICICLAEFEALNPLHFVPVLVDGDVIVSDSYAILLVSYFVRLNVKVNDYAVFVTDSKDKNG